LGGDGTSEFNPFVSIAYNWIQTMDLEWIHDASFIEKPKLCILIQ